MPALQPKSTKKQSCNQTLTKSNMLQKLLQKHSALLNNYKNNHWWTTALQSHSTTEKLYLLEPNKSAKKVCKSSTIFCNKLSGTYLQAQQRRLTNTNRREGGRLGQKIKRAMSDNRYQRERAQQINNNQQFKHRNLLAQFSRYNYACLMWEFFTHLLGILDVLRGNKPPQLNNY